MKNQPEKHLEALGIFVHGLLAGLHLLGVVHNVRKRNWFDCAAHGGALVYDAYAVNKHIQEIKK